jgi:hypothetical protein
MSCITYRQQERSIYSQSQCHDACQWQADTTHTGRKSKLVRLRRGVTPGMPGRAGTFGAAEGR